MPVETPITTKKGKVQPMTWRNSKPTKLFWVTLFAMALVPPVAALASTDSIYTTRAIYDVVAKLDGTNRRLDHIIELLTPREKGGGR